MQEANQGSSVTQQAYKVAKRLYRSYRHLRVTRMKPVDTAQLWKKALPEELVFWEELLSNPKSEFKGELDRRLDPNTPIDDVLITSHLAGLAQGEVSILDVGAGPVSSVGWRFDGKHIRVTAVDPLAAEYDAILLRNGVNPPVRTISCQAEKLLEQFQAGTFDIAYARNSLDHSYDPRLAIQNMFDVTASGGVVLLRHRAQEAENIDYFGLHQWNFDRRAGNFVLWSRGIEHDVTKLFADRATVVCEREGLWVTCVIAKR
jgi:SAM-dependent methyltransferase